MRNRERTRCVVGALALTAGLVVSACTDGTTAEGPQAAVVEEVAGSEMPLITLTEQAAARTGIETTTVETGSTLRVPYSALLYDPSGSTWVYTSPEPLTYVRAQVVVDVLDGDQVMLTDGPAPGTEIVTVGIAELYGAELGIGQ